MHKFTLLPQELQSAVFKHLKRDREALKVCSVVCHAWRDLASPHIFRTIRLDSEASFNILNILPSILTLVREVKVYSLPAECVALFLTKILPRLQWLQGLDIRFAVPNCLYDDLPLNTRRAISETLSISSFTSLVLAGVKFTSILVFQELFSTSPSLKRLRITDFSFQSNPVLSISHSEATSRARLEELTLLRGCLEGEWLCHPLCSLDLSSLRSLWVGGQPNQTPTLQLLKLAGPSLKEVHFDGVKISDYRNAIDLSNNPNLSSIGFTHEYSFLPRNCPIPTVELTFGTVHPNARPTTFVLSWFVDPLLGQRGLSEILPTPEELDYGQWKRLAPFFASDPRFSSLQKVELTLYYAEAWSEETAISYLEIAIKESQMTARGAEVSYKTIF
ncbi:hypothetical protein H2248_002396 [Termitomyces sp. 'cryptogamus']|nr:hypothetical protein H2248_002396 [Termitomyces sp. 'cryptogamus']